VRGVFEDDPQGVQELNLMVAFILKASGVRGRAV
jgi:hypothetical protein